MRVIQCEQGSDVWLKAREGKQTASRMADVLNYKMPSAAAAKQAEFALVRDAVAAGVKGDESEARANYRVELIAERLTGLACDFYVSPEMKWGTEQEPFARAAYEITTGNFLDQVGFVLHPTLDYLGASPDGIYGRHGGAEFKCPKSTTHLKWMMAGVVPEEHIPQMDAEMLCCEIDWIDFVSFDPRMIDENLKLFICRLRRDEARLAIMEEEAMKFESETVSQIARLCGTSMAVNHSRVPLSGELQSLHRSLDEVAV